MNYKEWKTQSGLIHASEEYSDMVFNLSEIKEILKALKIKINNKKRFLKEITNVEVNVKINYRRTHHEGTVRRKFGQFMKRVEHENYLLK